MKKYVEVEIELVVLQAQDIVTFSGGFDGNEQGFENPNADPNNFAGA